MKDITLRLNMIIAHLRNISQEVNSIYSELYEEGQEMPQRMEPPTQPQPAPAPVPPSPQEVHKETVTPMPPQKKSILDIVMGPKKVRQVCHSQKCKFSQNGVCIHHKALSTCEGRVI